MSKRIDTLMELRVKTVDELIKLNEEYRAELFALKFQVVVGSVEKTDRIRSLKKDIARIKTLLAEKSKSGENTNKIIKANYAEAVVKADTAGKAVRKKQREMIEKLQAEQFGTQADLGDDAIMAAMAAAVEESNNQTVEVKPATKPAAAKSTTKAAAPVKEAAPKAPAKTAAAKAEPATKPTATKAEPKTTTKAAAAKPAATKSTSKAKAADVEVKPTLVGTKATATKKASSKAAPETVKVEKPSAVKATGKGKAALGEVKTQKVEIASVKGENIEEINLKLASKPKESKTYTFGINAFEAKKQIEEASKKQEEKKLDKIKGAKK